MEATTLIGILAGLACIVVSILIGEGGSIMNFVDLPSVFIVFGGTLCAAAASFRSEVVKTMGIVFQYGIKKKKYDFNKDIDTIVDLATLARREGLLAVEDKAKDIEDPFLKKGLLLVVDGTNPDSILDILQDEIYYMQERHSMGRAIFESMASYAPAFGMIGTLIGLINMLQVLSDTDSLGPNMSVALVTTFYGVVLANLFFNPIARKLKAATLAETQRKELLLKGILAIGQGENQRTIRERLTSFIANRELAKRQDESRERRTETEEIKNG